MQVRGAERKGVEKEEREKEIGGWFRIPCRLCARVHVADMRGKAREERKKKGLHQLLFLLLRCPSFAQPEAGEV